MNQRNGETDAPKMQRVATLSTPTSCSRSQENFGNKTGNTRGSTQNLQFFGPVPREPGLSKPWQMLREA